LFINTAWGEAHPEGPPWSHPGRVYNLYLKYQTYIYDDIFRVLYVYSIPIHVARF